MASSVGVSYPVLPDRVARAAYALGAVGFAYLDALARSDWAGATSLLALFQQLYNENREATITGFSSADQLEAARILPRSVPISGSFDTATRTALVGALVSGLKIAPATADSMPSEAGALGRWFISTLVPLVPHNSSAGSKADFAWDIARVAETSDIGQAGTDVRGAIAPFIMGGAGAVDAPLAVSTSNAQARNLVEQSGGTQQVRAIEYGAGVDNPSGNPLTTVFGPMLVTAAAPKAFPDWGYYAVGAGVLGLGGLLAYLNWKRRQ